MKKILALLSILLIFNHFNLAGQSYNTAGGIRLGTDWGLTLQQRVGKHATVEGIIQKGFWREEATVTLLGEYHFPLIFRRFNFYTGGGLHKGWTTSSEQLYDDPFGITLIGGVEATVGRLNISWDFKPAINLEGGERKVYAQSGVSLRYVFWKRDGIRDWFKKGKWKFWKKKEDR